MATKSERRQATENRIKAMRHPLRRRILLYLIEHGVCSPSEIGAALEAPTPKVSHHCRRLAEYGCAELVGEEKSGGSVKHNYRHTDRHLIDDDEWGDLDPLVKEGLLVDFMQPAVDDFTRAAKAGVLGADEKFHITRTPLEGIDQQGLDELLEMHRRTFEDALEIQKRAALRIQQSGETPQKVSSFQGCFAVPAF